LAADINKDGHLSEIEYRYFYTPEDYSHMQPIVAHGIMNRFDTDKNGQISFQEFVGDRKSKKDLILYYCKILNVFNIYSIK